MSESIRNRIKGHRRVRAGDLVGHEWNYRLHPQVQREAVILPKMFAANFH